MTARFPHTAGAALAAGILAAGALLTAGCTSHSEPTAHRNDQVPAGEFRLVAFDTCKDALDDLKNAAKEYVGPYGLPGIGDVTPALDLGNNMRAMAPQAAGAPEAAKAAAPGMAPGAADAAGASEALGAQAPEFSGTNTNEAGVDEPDIVKTDGHRIVTVSEGVLRVVDPATKRVTGQLSLTTSDDDPARWAGGLADLLLAGDHALVLLNGWQAFPMVRGGIADSKSKLAVPPVETQTVRGPRLLLVDLSGTPRILSTYTMDGSLVDARQVGATARVVLRSSPKIAFPYTEKATDEQRTATNKAVIEKTNVDEWLPRYEATTDGKTERGQVECGQVSRPEKFSGASMVTVLTFDLGAQRLRTGEPVTILADGDTVYSNGPSLYVATNRQWMLGKMPAQGRTTPPDQLTNIYKFDTSGSARPRYVAAGSVPGDLINQYAMSEWDGHLRLATTNDTASSSTVYVLRQDGKRLVSTGKVGGLGKGERIYAVRFVGPTGYVVTFRQTDPLYTVDLHDPAKPVVTGELKINGYSAYLHPAEDGRLIGVGQDASDQGRVMGTQVSLFDVSNLAHPSRLAQYALTGSHSAAEFDPHAFLYWPADHLLVIPVTTYGPVNSGFAKTPPSGAVVLRVGDNSLTQLGTITQPSSAKSGGISRSLVIEHTLWTVSNVGLQATDISTLDKLAWIPFS